MTRLFLFTRISFTSAQRERVSTASISCKICSIMSYTDFERCLAGLDTIFPLCDYDLSRPSLTASSISTALDGIPYIAVSKSDISARRADRAPFSDKSHEINAQVVCLLIHLSTRLADRLTKPSPFEAKVGRHNRISAILPEASRSFKPLPPVPATSPLRLPSFLDYTFQSAVTPSFSQSIFQAISDGQFDPFESPTASTNSPYVPWAPPLRRNILRPLTPSSRFSALSSCYSRPYSRSGAQAPEPRMLHDLDPAVGRRGTAKLLQISKSLKHFRRAVKKNIKHVSKRITSLKKSPGQIPELPPRLPSFMPSTSSTSLDSSNTTTLAVWLAARQQQTEQESDQLHSMTLDECDQAGSWIDLSSHALDEFVLDSECISESTCDDTSSTQQVVRLLELKAASSPRRSLSPMSPRPTHSRSLPHLSFQASLEELWQGGGIALPGRASSDIALGGDREMNMPGGWAFGM